MIVGGVVAIFFGVAAEGKSLEDVATPLSVIGKPSEASSGTGADRRGIDPIARTSTGSVPDQRLSRARRRSHDDAGAPWRTRRGAAEPRRSGDHASTG